jgi:hypothetical protein
VRARPRPTSTAALLTLALLVALHAPAVAITGGAPVPEDDGRFDAVGALLLAFDVADDDPFHLGICSGTLVHTGGDRGADTCFLTAAHCTYDDPAFGEAIAGILASLLAADVSYAGLEVTFEADPWAEPVDGRRWWLADGTTTHRVEGQVLGDYGTHPSRKDDGDVALLELDGDPDVTPLLVDTTSLTSLSRKQLQAATWISVGYGSRLDGTLGRPEITDGGSRWYSAAPGAFLALRPGGLYLSQNAARDHGGTCYGDSGGPIFLDEDGDGEDLRLVAITSWGDANCVATNLTYRLDTASAQAVLGVSG